MGKKFGGVDEAARFVRVVDRARDRPDVKVWPAPHLLLETELLATSLLDAVPAETDYATLQMFVRTVLPAVAKSDHEIGTFRRAGSDHDVAEAICAAHRAVLEACRGAMDLLTRYRPQHERAEAWRSARTSMRAGARSLLRIVAGARRRKTKAPVTNTGPPPKAWQRAILAVAQGGEFGSLQALANEVGCSREHLSRSPIAAGNQEKTGSSKTPLLLPARRNDGRRVLELTEDGWKLVRSMGLKPFPGRHLRGS